MSNLRDAAHENFLSRTSGPKLDRVRSGQQRKEPTVVYNKAEIMALFTDIASDAYWSGTSAPTGIAGEHDGVWYVEYHAPDGFTFWRGVGRDSEGVFFEYRRTIPDEWRYQAECQECGTAFHEEESAAECCANKRKENTRDDE
jgi:hypothetical protein